MGRPDPGFLVVGRIGRPHGIRGEILVQLETDHPESAFAPGVVLFLAGSEAGVPEEGIPPLEVESGRPVRAGYLVAFEGIETREEAELLRGRFLLRDFADVPPLDPGEVFHHQLLGLSVTTVEGAHLGTVREVYDLAPVELLEVRDGARETMIPFRKEIIREVDLEGGRIVVELPDGWLDL